MLRNAWYAAAFATEVGDQPLSRELCGRSLVFYRDREGRAVALDGVCPHRGMDLGQGRVIDGTLVCGYHGWRFDPKGQCTHIPSQPASAKIPVQARLRAHSLRERDGIVWIWPGEIAPSREPPELDTGRELALRRTRVRAKLWQTPFVHVVEQALDTSHHAFVHSPSMGAGQSTLVPEQHIDADADGMGFRYAADPATRWAPPHEKLTSLRRRLSRRLLGLGPETGRRYRFQLGGVLQVWIERGAEREIGSIMMSPAGSRSTWVFMEMFRSRAKHPLGDAAERWFLERVMREDEAAARSLAWQDHPEGHPTSLSVPADQAGLAFRKLYERRLVAEQREPVLVESRG